MFKVLKAFKDKTDNKHEYAANGSFPRAGLEVDDNRIFQLTEMGFIAKVEDEVTETVAETTEEDLTKLKVADLKAKLDEKGIEYDANAKKDDLINLLK